MQPFCYRHDACAHNEASMLLIVQNTLLLTGTSGKPLSEAEAYDPAANTWTSLPSMSLPLASCSFTTSDNRLYVIGGLTIGGPSASLQQLSLNWSVSSQLDSIIFSSYLFMHHCVLFVSLFVLHLFLVFLCLWCVACTGNVDYFIKFEIVWNWPLWLTAHRHQCARCFSTTDIICDNKMQCIFIMWWSCSRGVCTI